MAENGVELELKEYESSGNKNPISPTRQPTNYDSLKEHDSNNGGLFFFSVISFLDFSGTPCFSDAMSIFFALYPCWCQSLNCEIVTSRYFTRN